MNADSEDLYDNYDQDPREAGDKKPEETEEQTALLPKSFFGGKELEIGAKYTVEIAAVHEQEAECRLVAEDANGVGIESGAALVVGYRVFNLDGPFLRLRLASWPGFAPDVPLFSVGVHGQLQGIPCVRLPGPGDGLIDAGVRGRFPRDNSQLLFIAIQNERIAIGSNWHGPARC